VSVDESQLGQSNSVFEGATVLSEAPVPYQPQPSHLPAPQSTMAPAQRVVVSDNPLRRRCHLPGLRPRRARARHRRNSLQRTAVRPVQSHQRFDGRNSAHGDRGRIRTFPAAASPRPTETALAFQPPFRIDLREVGSSTLPSPTSFRLAERVVTYRVFAGAKTPSGWRVAGLSEFVVVEFAPAAAGGWDAAAGPQP